MERQVGEIFEYNGEWYQCLEIKGCIGCAFYNFACADIRNVIGKCVSGSRSDTTSVIFKKLEKVGEPFTSRVIHIQFQRYKIYTNPIIDPTENVNYINGYLNEENTIAIEIKQNEEDMKEKKVLLKKEDIYFLCSKFNQIVKYCVIHGYDEDSTQHEFEKLFLIAEETDIKSNLKPFDLEAAKAGNPVCTRDGRKARIICFDRKDVRPIIALIKSDNGDEGVYYYYADGLNLDSYPSVFDLMMLPEKKEGWVNIYDDMVMYESEEEAKICIATERNYIATAKVEWEE